MTIYRTPGERRIYVDPELAAEAGLDIEHLRRFYAANNIEIVTDPEFKMLNVTEDTAVARASRYGDKFGPAPAHRVARKRKHQPKAKPTGKMCRACETTKAFDQFPTSANGRVLWTCHDCIEARTNATERQCPKCGKTKNIDQFPISAASLGGRTKSCADCRNYRTRR
jgi:hypothetical protein